MSELMLKSIYDLLDKNYFIPSYQRGYRWEKRQIQDLLEDLYSFACDKDKSDGSFYCLQPVVVRKCNDLTKAANGLQSELDNNEWYEVIDGQQRLTSLSFLECSNITLSSLVLFVLYLFFRANIVQPFAFVLEISRSG